MTPYLSIKKSACFGKHILITGGAGYLATNLMSQLQDIDCSVIRLDRPGAKFMPVIGKVRVQDIEGDIRERTVWNAALTNVNIVFHFAAQTSIYVAEKTPSDDLDINVMPMLYLLETCSEKGICPTIFFSGTVTETGLPASLPVNEGTPDHPITVYDLHKKLAEDHLLHYIHKGLVGGAVLRLANVYGPGPKSSSADRGVLNMMIHKALNGEALTIYGNGNYLRDYIYIEDVTRAFIYAAGKLEGVNGQYFVLGSGHGHTIKEAINLVAERVENKTGQHTRVIHVDAPSYLSQIEERNFVADTTRFFQSTGWEARVSLIEGIDRTIDCLVSQGAYS